MIQEIKNIIADQLVDWAISLYGGEMKISLCLWAISNFKPQKSQQGESNE